MSDVGKIEYRVKKIVRYQVTRHLESASGLTGSTDQKGEYANADIAFEVATALCKADHERFGFLPGDERIIYPEHPDRADERARKVKSDVYMRELNADYAKAAASGSVSGLSGQPISAGPDNALLDKQRIHQGFRNQG